MKPVPSLPESEPKTALQYAAKQLQQLAADATNRPERDGVAPSHCPEIRPELQRALDATWQRSEAVYRKLADVS